MLKTNHYPETWRMFRSKIHLSLNVSGSEDDSLHCSAPAGLCDVTMVIKRSINLSYREFMISIWI